MRFSVGSRPSPAILVAVVALVFAIVGAAVAGTGTGTNPLEKKLTKSQVKKIAKKQAKKEIKKAAPGLSVLSAETAEDAAKLDGLDANGIVRATTATESTDINDFDSATFTDLVSRSVTAPGPGILVINAQVNVNQDASDLDPAIMNLVGAVDGAPATTETNVRATEEGTNDQTGTISGAVAVTAGDHTVALQGREVGPGLAYISERSITTMFVPFGNAGDAGSLSPAGTANANR